MFALYHRGSARNEQSHANEARNYPQDAPQKRYGANDSRGARIRGGVLGRRKRNRPVTPLTGMILSAIHDSKNDEVQRL